MGQVGRIDGQSPGDRKDTPWQRMSDAELQQAVAAASGRVMIGFKDPEAAMGVDNAGRVLARSQSTRDAVARLRSTNAAILYEFERMPAVVAKISPDQVSELRADPYVDYVEPSTQGEWSTETTPWNVTRVGAPAGWTLSTGYGVKILIIDSGARPGGHRDLYIPVAFRCISGPVEDSAGIGHGTHVLGIAAALNNTVDVVGVSYNASAWMANITGVNNEPDAAEAACAVDVGRVNDVFAVNMSFNIASHTGLTDAINGAYNQDGMLFVASAGNNNGGPVTYPATLSTVIAVSATDNTNTIASFSNVGSKVELTAPGVGILSTAMPGAIKCPGTYTAYCSGTSMAAPHVTAAAASLKARYPGWNNAMIRGRLQATATDLGPAGRDNSYGYGLVNVDKALRMTADITGSLFAYAGYPQTWSASVSGGQSPYAYQWYVDGTPSGTGSSLNHTPGSSDFWLKLSVVDNLSYGAADSIHVEVSGCTPPIIFC